RGGDLSRGWYGRKPGRRLAALRRQRILLGFRRVAAAQELQPRDIGRQHDATAARRRGSSVGRRARRGARRHGSLSRGRAASLAAGTDRGPVRTPLGDREAARRMAAFSTVPFLWLSRSWTTRRVTATRTRS